MLYLIVVSLLWAPSFGLVAHHLKGVDPSFVAAARIVLSLFVFAPLIRLQGMPLRRILVLLALGALQFGLMYVLYLQSFRWIRGVEAALFTIFTPLLVTLFNDLLQRRMSWLLLLTAGLTVAGTAVIQWTELQREGLRIGFVLMQLSNACFALGQVLYRRLAPTFGKSDSQLMGTMYLGAAVIACAAAALSFHPAVVTNLSRDQVLVLLYLGAIASGIGFFLFNAGARRTDVGTLAIFNNVKVPLAVLASVLIFGDPVNWPRLLIGGAIIGAALVLNENSGRKTTLTSAP